MPATFSGNFGPLRPAVLQAAKERLGVTLPSDYEQFLLRNNGGRPSPVGRAGPPGVMVPGCGDIILDFLYGVRGQRRSYDLEREQMLVRQSEPLPARFLVIGRDTVGNALLLDTKGGAVWYWDRAGRFPGIKRAGNRHRTANEPAANPV